METNGETWIKFRLEKGIEEKPKKSFKREDEATRTCRSAVDRESAQRKLANGRGHQGEGEWKMFKTRRSMRL